MSVAKSVDLIAISIGHSLFSKLSNVEKMQNYPDLGYVDLNYKDKLG